MDQKSLITEKPIATFDRSSSYISAIALEICGGVVAHVIFAIVFATFLYNSSYYPPECYNTLLYFWAEANVYYFFTASILTTIICPLLICLSHKYENNKVYHSASEGLLNVIRFGVGLMAIFLWVGLFVAYCKQEQDCGQLGSLIFAYIIIVSCTIFIGCLVLVGLCSMFYINQKSIMPNNNREAERSQEFERMNV